MLGTRAVLSVMLVLPAGILVSHQASAAPTGEEIYLSLCAECHGAGGEGVPGRYEQLLRGDRSLQALAEIIDWTMPSDDPDLCTGEDAELVAKYIHEAFYSEQARISEQPARIELSRMTVRQYLNAAADLAAVFAGETRLDDRRGLQGQYYTSRRFRGDNRAFERIDPQVAFAFGADSPDPGKIDSEEYGVQWQGGVIAEETGDYEFVLISENGVRLWVNDPDTPLIDAWVQSGDQTEHRAMLRLLGGRVYPIRLDFMKFKNATASVQLQWQPPHRVREVIPQRNLSPQRFPPVLVINTDFPADDSTAGYERGTSVSQLWSRATAYAAVEIANHVAQNVAEWARAGEGVSDRAERLREFGHRFAERAFRRPLSDEQKRFFIDAHFEGQDDPDKALKRAVLLVATSPRYLYAELAPDEPDDFDVAARLAFGLWDSLPDAELWRTASEGQLRRPEQVAAQARRMLDDPRTRSKLRYFFHQWLEVERGFDVSKDRELYPDFEPAIASDALTSLDLLIEDAVWNSNFRELFVTGDIFVNRRLASFYGLPAPAEDGFHKVARGPDQQSGVLTHPYLMLGLSYHNASSPIHRGVFLARSVLGRTLNSPPIAVSPEDGDFGPDLTTREKVALQTQPEACQTCHRMINPLGFTLENYDAVGRFRAREHDQPVDASGGYQTLAGAAVEFDGARELAQFVGQSEEVHRSFIRQLFHYLVKQPLNAYGATTADDLETAFVDADYSIQTLMVEILRTSALAGP